MKTWLLFTLLVAISLQAQVDVGLWENKLEAGQIDELIEDVRANCISFRPTAEHVERLQAHPELLLAVIHCLYDKLDAFRGQQLYAPPQVVAPTPGSTPEPPKPGGPSHIYAAPANLHALKVAESLRTIQTAATISEVGARTQAILDARQLIINLIKDNGDKISGEAVAQEYGGQLPTSWVEKAIERGREAAKKGAPTLKFDIKRRTDFLIDRDERELRVTLSLSLLNGSYSDDSPLNLAEQWLWGPQEFTVTYDPRENRFIQPELDISGLRQFRLDNYLNDREPLQLPPGQWLIEIASYNSRRIKSRDRHVFNLEAGGQYALRMGWETKRGVRKMDFEVAPSTD